MCLNIKWWSVKRIALTDIECFKYVYKDTQLKDVFRTPHKNTIVRIGETYESPIKRECNPWVSWRNRFTIEQALHSFKHVKDARGKGTIVRCIIPKGSRYYVGRWGISKNDPISYASNRIKYVEII